MPAAQHEAALSLAGVSGLVDPIEKGSNQGIESGVLAHPGEFRVGCEGMFGDEAADLRVGVRAFFFGSSGKSLSKRVVQAI